MSERLRLVFFGSDPIALPLLESLARPASSAVEIVAVFTQPDRATGRGQKIQPNAIKGWALARDLPVFQPEKLTADVQAQLASLGADVGLVMAYGHILRDEFIAIPRFGMLNLHTSILPRFRGASPIQSATACGEKETGVTLMRIVRKLDAGPVAAVERVRIEPLDTALEVEAKLAAASVPLVEGVLPRLADGKVVFVPQDESAATYCRKLTKDDSAVDFATEARLLAARINGLFPWPACSVEIGGQLVKIGLADSLEAVAPAAPVQVGEVLGADEYGVLVATSRGTVRLRKLQRAGGRMLPTAEFLRGFPIERGTVLPSQPMTTLVTTR